MAKKTDLECDRPKVELGYLEETEGWRLESRFFPSKVGGKPAWLDFLQLPSKEKLQCSKCTHPCIFLCQVYAPIETLSKCFHRTIFVFMCLNPECCEGNGHQNFKVFRCQLPRTNNFFPYDPPEEDETWQQDLTAESISKLCHVCGCKGTSVCGKCKQISYCSKEHQVADWKAGHKEYCGKRFTRGGEGLLIPQFELITESEGQSSTKHEVDSGDNEKLRKYEELFNEGALGSLQGDSSVDEDLLAMAATEEDKEFIKFNTRVKENPDQVLRYEIGGMPLWVSADLIPDVIPVCLYCGGQRQFEFQIMPQMLCYLGLDRVEKSVDWGVLAIYTCKTSCNDGPAYKSEFLWKQDFKETNVETVQSIETE